MKEECHRYLFIYLFIYLVKNHACGCSADSFLYCSFLGDEDDDISESMFGFAHAYVSILKSVRTGPMEQTILAQYKQVVVLQHASIAEEHSHLFNDLLSLVIKKLQYDESYNFETEVWNQIGDRLCWLLTGCAMSCRVKTK